MISRRTFETVSEQLANIKFENYCEDLDNMLSLAFERAVNRDQRLCNKTKERLFDRYIKELKTESRRIYNGVIKNLTGNI